MVSELTLGLCREHSSIFTKRYIHTRNPTQFRWPFWEGTHPYRPPRFWAPLWAHGEMETKSSGVHQPVNAPREGGARPLGSGSKFPLTYIYGRNLGTPSGFGPARDCDPDIDRRRPEHLLSDNDTDDFTLTVCGVHPSLVSISTLLLRSADVRRLNDSGKLSLRGDNGK